MSGLGDMTKDELLAEAAAQGIEVKDYWTKDQIREAIEGTGEGAPEAGLQVTTTMTKDYLTRLLNNPTPGTSNATDFLGRAVAAGNKDYLGRSLVA